VITIDDYDNYYAAMESMSMDSTITPVTVTTTIIEDIYLDCSIVKGKTLCTTASTSIQDDDSSDDGEITEIIRKPLQLPVTGRMGTATSSGILPAVERGLI